ncbi:M48 family metallopeptidase [Paramagnetospirillum magneticum]|uniref:M48 family metallopeptidase n=1 Tax=Paramagnetospirillum magneticum TaxID=84159 RepID=UPI0002E8D866|nr:M48 family metallopeptidase [Paramagnetospirillum magneticum]
MTAAMMAAALGACAPTTQRPEVDAKSLRTETNQQYALLLQNHLEQRSLFDGVVHRLSVAASDFCDARINWRTGFLTLSTDDVNGAAGKLLATAYPGLSSTPMVISVTRGSAAERAGLKTGDLVTAMGGFPIPATKSFLESTSARFNRATNAPITLAIRRGDQTSDLVITPERACDYPSNIIVDSSMNAFATEKDINVQTGMLDFLKSEEELALIMGHELAHSLRKHGGMGAKGGNMVAGQVAGGVLDVIAALGGVNTGGYFSKSGGAMARNINSQDYENEADYVGLYIMARAGYTIDDAPKVWRRMAVSDPSSISHATTHPTAPERFVNLNATIQEIRNKQAAGLPLIPNEQPKAVETPKAPAVGNP